MDCEISMFEFHTDNDILTDFSSFDSYNNVFCCINEYETEESAIKTQKPLFIVKEERMSNSGKLTQRTKKSFKCEECGKMYKTKENYLLHYSNKHLNQKPYKCRFCSMRYSHRNGRRYHEKNHHEDADLQSSQLTHLSQLVKI